MKRLLNTLYVTTPNAYLSLDGENVVISVERKEIKRLPLHNFENIVTFGWQGASPALMRHVSELGIGLAFFSKSGRFLCRVEGEVRGNVLLRREQYRIADNSERSLRISINMIGAKTANSRSVLMRALRDHPLIPSAESVRSAADYLAGSMEKLRCADSIDELRGLEGVNASMYFSVFDSLILQNKSDFSFDTREKHPPTDPVNALLSFCYSMLANECASALTAAGLDPYVGFMHTDRPGRKSLALDLMEELRSVYCDRFVLSLINLRQIKPDDFVEKENGTVLLSDEGRKTLLSAWQKRKQETIEHPFLGEKCEWGLLPLLQAQLLARHIRGDMDEYPPYLWR
ncbi:MAG: type I-C CRISPR-associated endonuclease Cas1 [Clostridiales bacterium]|nr:type I-C CRISPR-associated endonuclease Cas1 [Clostridiales bacterium]